MVLTARASPAVAIASLQGFEGVPAPAVGVEPVPPGSPPTVVWPRAPPAETMPRTTTVGSQLLKCPLPVGNTSAKYCEAADEQCNGAADQCRIDFRCRDMGASSGWRWWWRRRRLIGFGCAEA